MRKVIYLAIGVLFHFFFKYIPVLGNIWLFGSQDGERYIDNSKYLFEYVRNNHKEIKAVWVTRSKSVQKYLKSKNIPVVNNTSLIGLLYVAIARIIIFSTCRSDILYVHPKKGRLIVNLWHGMPIKKIGHDYTPHKPENKNWKGQLWDTFVTGYKHEDSNIVISTSDYYAKIMAGAFNNNRVFVTGQPRTDMFFHWNTNDVKQKIGFNTKDILITYMPTHRAYGKGEMNPRVFEHNIEAIEYFKENNIKIIYKYHKNMINHHKNSEDFPEVFVDLTRLDIDPQELLFITDILITDYSSCFIDYLLLNRPIIFYLYDNYEDEDNEVYYYLQEQRIGSVANTEDCLLNEIISTHRNSSQYEGKITRKFNKYSDPKSCKRVYELIEKFSCQNSIF